MAPSKHSRAPFLRQQTSRERPPHVHTGETKVFVGRLKTKEPPEQNQISWGHKQWKTEHFSSSRPALPSSEGTAVNGADIVQPISNVEEGLKRSAADIVTTWWSHSSWNLAVIGLSTSHPPRQLQCSYFGTSVPVNLPSLSATCYMVHAFTAVQPFDDPCRFGSQWRCGNWFWFLFCGLLS
jgi:hypothetical protein